MGLPANTIKIGIANSYQKPVATSMILLAKVWVIGYALLVLGILLGLAVVARPSRRKPDKVRKFSNL